MRRLILHLCLQIQRLNLIPGPGGPPEKLQGGGDTRLMGKASDLDQPSQPLPTMALDQTGQYHLQGDTVQRIVNRIMVDTF